LTATKQQEAPGIRAVAVAVAVNDHVNVYVNDHVNEALAGP
jgi:hypothetical protein